MPRLAGHRCFECGAPAHHAHHVVPYSLGGRRTIPLCAYHHGLLHDIRYGRANYSHSTLVKRALQQCKERGQKLGRPLCPIHSLNPEDYAHLSLRACAKALNISPSVVFRWRRAFKPLGLVRVRDHHLPP